MLSPALSLILPPAGSSLSIPSTMTVTSVSSLPPCSRRVIELDDQISASTVDDVLHLDPVEMKWSDLVGINDQNLFGVELPLPFLQVLGIAVSQRKDGEAGASKVSMSKVGDIPTQSPINNLGGLSQICLPFFDLPIGKGRKKELTGSQEAVAITDDRN